MVKEQSIDPRILQIAAKIKRLRIEKGYSSYEKFAYDHDLPRVGYGNHEKGTNFTFASLLRILDIHNISMKEFFKDLEG
ncbi:XRE family transcriptional regulator [Rhodocytophaga aerolata]|uniref:XRE family transcriptional regulator n=1 Tax=Rhodocytophaga aerolata TaxID=455078 RepID=A0ABT8RH91_9BACT|nr:XRE family transcriptional regulator [Rhodocytophaga aerolata]MDO1451076.1 XRE family transcriptional regulator [Rhodocytophaga aerolata]